MLSTLHHGVQFRLGLRSFNLWFVTFRTHKQDDQSDKGSMHLTEESVDSKSTPSQSSESSFPEEPTTCCMSGCANCVWLDYVEKITTYYRDGGDQAKREIEERVQDPSMKAFLMTEMRMRDKLKDDER